MGGRGARQRKEKRAEMGRDPWKRQHRNGTSGWGHSEQPDRIRDFLGGAHGTGGWGGGHQARCPNATWDLH